MTQDVVHLGLAAAEKNTPEPGALFVHVQVCAKWVFVMIRICCESFVFCLPPPAQAAANMLSWKPEVVQTTENRIRLGQGVGVDEMRYTYCIIDSRSFVWKCFLIHRCHHPCHASTLCVPLMQTDLTNTNMLFCLLSVFISPFSPKATAEAAATFIWVKQALCKRADRCSLRFYCSGAQPSRAVRQN